jgi:DUF1365 family protein
MTATALAPVAPPTAPRPRAADRAVAAIYEGTVGHRRYGPAVREFTPKLFLAYLDVDALPGSLDTLPLWSARRVAPVHFRREDFFDGGTGPLGDAVRDLVEVRLGRRPSGPVFLLAHLRTFGWLANPLAVYYCWTPDGDGLDAVVLEVTNTPWGERHWYVFDARGGRTSSHTPKAMHVSPFLPMDLEYRVTWTVPGTALRLRIEVTRESAPVFEADLILRRATLDRWTAAHVLLRRPLMPLRVSAAIYRRALRLLLERVPRYRHPERTGMGRR